MARTILISALLAFASLRVADAAHGTFADARTVGNAAPYEQRYYLIDGPDYRPIARATFASYAGECRPRVDRSYADLLVVTHLCYI